MRQVKTTDTKEKLRFLQRFALWFFTRPHKTALLLFIVAAFGVLSYTTLLKREGFPSVSIPYAIGQGTYFGADAAKIDAEAARPVSDYLLRQPGVKTVKATSQNNIFMVVVQYQEGTDAGSRTRALLDQLKTQHILPTRAAFNFEAARFGFTERGDDAVVSFVSSRHPEQSVTDLVAPAQAAAQFIQNRKLSLVKSVSIINPVQEAVEPLTGQTERVQTKFERYGLREGNETKFYNSVAIGLSLQKGGDAIKFNDEIQSALDAYNAQHKADGYAMHISASYAPSIRQQIAELQKTLLEGLLAVLAVGSIVIAVRASFITVLSMGTVILAVLGLLELIGYSLNTITLFTLILGLSLIVDDTIIMVEALDVQRKRKTDRRDIVATATGKVGRAMIAATTTAALSFAPLLFVGGILGTFIRAIPVTIISALLISLVVALVFIPLYARYILLGRKHIGVRAEHELAAGLESKIARWLSAPMLWAQHSKRKITLVGSGAIVLTAAFVAISGFLFTKITVNIFPPSKDTNQLTMTLDFAAGTTINQAEATTDKALVLMKGVLGKDFLHGANYGAANAQQAQFYIELTDYDHRQVTAPQYIAKLKAAFRGFSAATVSFATVDVGPPASQFTARVMTGDNRPQAVRLAQDIVDYIRSADIRRLDGSKIGIGSVQLENTDVYRRADGQAYIGLSATFTDTDTTSLVTLTKEAVEKEFNAARVRSYGLPADALSFDFGQEDENQDSFKSLLLAFPIVLTVIYLVLAVQFRSLLQPLIIFMAIPFSLLGITLGLWLTNNAFSFFAMLGFFALIGLSIKNTILLTDYANQSRRAGMNPVDAAHEALAERFRPLIATSLTAVVSLIPLALSSPFWQGLAVVLMFGLLSSTLMVVTVFPYFYLGGEFFRGIWRRRVSTPLRRQLRRG